MFQYNLAFTRNPFVFTDSRTGIDQPPSGWPFTIFRDGDELYTGRFCYPFTINVADILDAFAPVLSEPARAAAVADSALILIERAEDWANRMFVVSFEGLAQLESTVVAFPGGISRRALRRLADSGSNIFDARFLNRDVNFFMTARTAGRDIVMRETELYPLYFITDDPNTRLRFVEGATGAAFNDVAVDEGVHALDVDRLRQLIYQRDGVLASSFEVYRDGRYSCRIIIAPGEPARERYRLKFRNSLGVFEIMEMAGPLTVSPTYETAEEATYKVYDSLTDDYTAARNRLPRSRSLKAKTGIKRPEELRLIMDLLASEEVWLLDYEQQPLRVIPTAETLDHLNLPDIPQAFTISLEVADDDICIADFFGSRAGRIHSSQFDTTFN